MPNHPTVSIVVPTYNRVHTLPRAIDSVLRQDYPDWELVIVDDGSTDNTAEILVQYQDSRIQVVKHSRNRGVTAAENTGLDMMSGEWFTFLGSDDEIVPNALSALLQPIQFDPTIDAITCNCIDSVTGQFSGQGLDHDQYLDFETMVRRCRGEHWGITKQGLLGSFRFNEKISSESILWYKIGQDAHRYYIHKGLRIYHTEGQDRISTPSAQKNLDRKRAMFRAMQNEVEYIEILKRWKTEDYASVMFNIALVNILDGRRRDARRAYQEFKQVGSPLRRAMLLSGMLFGPRWMEIVYRLGASFRQR